MTILFSSQPSSKHRERLMKQFPEQSFTFCNTMDEAISYLPEAEVLVTYGGDLTADLLEQATQLKWMMILSAGMDKMPLKAIEKRDILVTNVRGIHQTPMAEYAIAMLLQVFRQSKTIIKNETNHVWDKQIHIVELNGKTMLIVGAGAIGQEVARLAKAFRMQTIGVSKSGKTVEHFDENHPNHELEKLLPKADVVVSVLPSTPETSYFYTEKHFQLMPEHAVFLNMGRGDVVASDVLLQAVRNREIAHAVLDVQEQEPLPDNSPFWEEERITITPHISGLSPHYVTRALEIFSKNLSIYLENRTDFINQIDVSRGY
ncbi:D-2-hydroxyacid dehydrogenase [Lentibacillus sp. L22]|uniref:D-2-hydroxyacid dehydrogenase n=1 Tax=Lentibacillus TaxID=175304 RepID=UPI0022B144E5|nr:D-2-hydroxyacid dehydrogenase [Lentibacillus daqui]